MDTTQIPRPFRELLKSLLDEDVEFLVVGGYAVIAHGYVRTTGDIDIWVMADPSNASTILQSLDQLGYNSTPDAIQVLQTEPAVLRIGNPPFRIDIMTRVDGCEFTTAWKRRTTIDLDGMPVPFLNLEDLRAAKEAAGRHKDLNDLENLPPA